MKGVKAEGGPEWERKSSKDMQYGEGEGNEDTKAVVFPDTVCVCCN